MGTLGWGFRSRGHSVGPRRRSPSMLRSNDGRAAWPARICYAESRGRTRSLSTHRAVIVPGRDSAAKIGRTGESSREEIMRLGVCVAAEVMLAAGLSAGQSAWAAEPATVVATAIEKLGG